MKPTHEPTRDQIRQVKVARTAMGPYFVKDNLDLGLLNDDAFVAWDEIALEQYMREGGQFDDEGILNPSNEKHFEACQNYASELIADYRKFASKAFLSRVILAYDADAIHEACYSLGYPVEWESFQNQLRSYTLSDMLDLLDELELHHCKEE